MRHFSSILLFISAMTMIVVAVGASYYAGQHSCDEYGYMRVNPHTSGPDTVYLIDSSGIHQVTTPAGVHIIVDPPTNP